MSQPAGRTLRFAVQFWGQQDSIHNLQFSGLKEPDMRATGVHTVCMWIFFVFALTKAHTRTQTHTHTHTCTHAHMHTCTLAHMHTHTHAQTHTHTYKKKMSERLTGSDCFFYFFSSQTFRREGKHKRWKSHNIKSIKFERLKLQQNASNTKNK